MCSKVNILRAVLIVLLIAIFFTIFNFSDQDGEQSASISREITVNVTKNVKSIQKLEQSEKEIVLSKVEHHIRKLAHYSLYTAVGVLSMSLMSTYNLKNLKRGEISLGIGVIYAISDEFHQSFVADRTASLGDVGIDSAGVITGIFIVMGIVAIAKKIKTKNFT